MNTRVPARGPRARNVEIKYDNGAVVSIDCVSIEDEYARNMLERSELDWLLCNKPLEYVQLVLSGGLEKYLQGPYTRMQ